MKKILSLIFAISLTLSACGTTATQPALPAQTSTPTKPPTPTQTPVPLTATTTPSPTITPLPTIPTFTPTFDASTIATVTPAEKAECPTPKKNVEIKLSSFYDTNDYYPDLVEALNQGASIKDVVDVFEKELKNFYSFAFDFTIFYEAIDVTNDGVPEIILPGEFHHAIILGCNTGKYKVLYSQSYLDYINLKVVDANQNGVPEILIGDEICTNTGCLFNLSIIEWKNNNFETLLTDVSSNFTSWSSLKVENIDNDSLLEIYWQNGIPFDALVDSVLRGETKIYKWSGDTFTPLQSFYTPPIFLFQAIQDADQETNNKSYNKALINYQNVIHKNNLDWWSLKREEYERVTNPHTFNPNNPPTFPPVPTEDPAEYPSLAAYAYYRIMLLHLAQGQESEAASTYQTLQETFGTDLYAAPYIEMATAFWETYQSTQRMYDGCAAAIQFAVAHPEILAPLGSDYYGWQNHTYEPADVCPFR